MRIPLITFIALFVGVIGCDQGSSSSRMSDEKVEIAKDKIKVADNATLTAVHATIEAAIAKRDEYVQTLTKEHEELTMTIADLKSSTIEAEGKIKRDLDSKVEAAQAKLDVATAKLKELKEEDVDRWEKAKDGVANAFAEVKVATTEAATATRDEFVREITKRMDQVNLKYDELKASATKAEGSAKIALDKKLEEARLRRDSATKKLEELKAEGADRWTKVKDGVSNAFKDLQTIFD